MGQLYFQRFEYRGAPSKAEFDQAWGIALQTFAKSGNWGGVENGVRHIKTYGTAWGGYALLEVDDPQELPVIRRITSRTTRIWCGSHSSRCSISTRLSRAG